jgi:type IV fimbrial biogenesis protein FimT
MTSPAITPTDRQLGFTLIELLSVFAIIGIIGFSTPTIMDALNTSKQTAVINEFAKTVAFAKEQALARKTTVSLCIANETHSDCTSSTNNWRNGYLVKVDKTGQILKTQKQLPENINIISGDSSAIEFSGNGLIATSRLFKFCDDSKQGTIRNMIINNGSQVKIANFTNQGKCTS